ncbi:MAG: lysostaphin resistance A-like protein [Rudaea sp.]
MKAHAQSGFPWAFIVLTYAFTWLILLPAVLAAFARQPLPFPLLLLVATAQFGPTVAAFILTWRAEGGHGALSLLKRAFDARIPLPWLLTIFLLPLAVGAIALYASVLSGGPAPTLALLSQPAAIVPMFLFILLLQGPVPEEFGWRGYLLDRLQSRYSALTASVIVGITWGVWHLPLFYIGYLPFPFWSYLIAVVALSILMTWIYNSTGGKLLAALFFHAMFNLSIALFPPMSETAGGDSRGFIVLMLVYALAAALVVVLWGAQTLSRGHRVAGTAMPMR